MFMSEPPSARVVEKRLLLAVDYISFHGNRPVKFSTESTCFYSWIFCQTEEREHKGQLCFVDRPIVVRRAECEGCVTVRHVEIRSGFYIFRSHHKRCCANDSAYMGLFFRKSFESIWTNLSKCFLYHLFHRDTMRKLWWTEEGLEPCWRPTLRRMNWKVNLSSLPCIRWRTERESAGKPVCWRQGDISQADYSESKARRPPILICVTFMSSVCRPSGFVKTVWRSILLHRILMTFTLSHPSIFHSSLCSRVSCLFALLAKYVFFVLKNSYEFSPCLEKMNTEKCWLWRILVWS